jgi:hypothetical protein
MSITQCKEFSIVQCFLTAAAKFWTSAGKEHMKYRVASVVFPACSRNEVTLPIDLIPGHWSFVESKSTLLVLLPCDKRVADKTAIS